MSTYSTKPATYPEPEQVLADAEIDAEVDQFRDFLDQLAPDDFVEGDVDPDADIIDAEIIDAEIIEPHDPDREPEA